jgi:hypothetical protein
MCGEMLSHLVVLQYLYIKAKYIAGWVSKYIVRNNVFEDNYTLAISSDILIGSVLLTTS